MPRVATTSTSRSHKLADGGKMPPCPPLRLRCPQDSCPWSFRTQTDLRRHLPRHMSPEEREKQMYKCPQAGCTHKSLQKSNLETHFISKHTGSKPHVCKQCTYCTSDPSCLHRHMRAAHAYVSRTAPRKKRSGASSASSSVSSLSIPASPASDYSEFTADVDSSSYAHVMDSPSSCASSSSDEVFAYNTPFSVTDVLYLDATFPFPTSSPSPSTHFSYLPASPCDSADWTQDAALFLHPQYAAKNPYGSAVGVVEVEPPVIQYPAEGIDFFRVGWDAAVSYEMEPQQQEPQYMFVPPPVYEYDFAYAVEPFSTFDLESATMGIPSTFGGEWVEALC
ncbi:hypothetical protein B0H12DRAFT_283106 [Mycena haematopus]|nr:hypothetical protein B0H12DRAFT_283106 [Mycena haematopus]